MRRDDFESSENADTYLPKIPDKSTKSARLGGEVFKLPQASAAAKLLSDMHIDDWPKSEKWCKKLQRSLQMEASNLKRQHFLAIRVVR